MPADDTVQAGLLRGVAAAEGGGVNREALPCLLCGCPTTSVHQACSRTPACRRAQWRSHNDAVRRSEPDTERVEAARVAYAALLAGRRARGVPVEGWPTEWLDDVFAVPDSGRK